MGRLYCSHLVFIGLMKYTQVGTIRAYSYAILSLCSNAGFGSGFKLACCLGIFSICCL